MVVSTLERSREKPFALVVDGNVTSSVIEIAESMGVKVIVAKNFSATSNTIKLLSY